MSGSESDGGILSAPPDRKQMEGLVAALLDRRNRPTKLAPLLAPEADWTINADEASWPFAGRRLRRESILAYFKAFNVEFQQKKIRILNILIEGEQACAQYETRLRHRGTGREAAVQCLCFIRLEGDRIVDVHEFLDTALLLRLSESVER